MPFPLGVQKHRTGDSWKEMLLPPGEGDMSLMAEHGSPAHHTWMQAYAISQSLS